MAHVWRSVGAVAVYSAWRVLAVTVVAIALLVLAGFLLGRATVEDPDVAAQSRPAPTTTTAASPRPDAEPAKDPAAVRAAARTGYRRGYRSGAQDALGGLSGLESLKVGGAYLLRIKPGSGGSERAIGPHVRVREGYAYRLCRNGTKICESPLADPARGSTPPSSGTRGSGTAPLKVPAGSGAGTPAG